MLSVYAVLQVDLRQIAHILNLLTLQNLVSARLSLSPSDRIATVSTHGTALISTNIDGDSGSCFLLGYRPAIMSMNGRSIFSELRTKIHY